MSVHAVSIREASSSQVLVSPTSTAETLHSSNDQARQNLVLKARKQLLVKATILRRKASSLFTPDKPIKGAPTTGSSIVAIAKASWLNILLVFIPVGWALHFAGVNDIIVFVCTFLAIIPLAQLLSFATEELAIRVGQTLGGLLNATLGNAVELIVAIIALAQCKLTIVQSSPVVGSILSNLLLVLGMCFFAGGTQFSEQGFLVTPSQLNSTLLVMSVISILLPGAFIMAIQSSNNSDNISSDNVTNSEQADDILKMSHGVAIILLIIYACNLAFTLWSHKSVMNEKAVQSTAYPKTLTNPALAFKRQIGKAHNRLRRSTSHPGPPSVTSQVPVSIAADAENDMRPVVTTLSDNEEGVSGVPDEDDEAEVIQMTVPVTVGLLVVVTVLVGITAEFLVSSIDGVTATGNISQQFVGLILLPIVGNAAEHVTAVTVSMKNKLDLSIGVAVGSSIQIALFVIPFIVVLAWIMGKPLSLLFDPFQSVVLFLAVLTVNYCVQDGKSNWLEGMILMNLYAIIAVCFWFYPGYNPTETLGLTCA